MSVSTRGRPGLLLSVLVAWEDGLCAYHSLVHQLLYQVAVVVAQSGMRGWAFHGPLALQAFHLLFQGGDSRHEWLWLERVTVWLEASQSFSTQVAFKVQQISDLDVSRHWWTSLVD